MSSVEVWQTRFLRKPEKVDDKLSAYLHKGKAYATWAKVHAKIPVSVELAMELGARREPCPYVGQSPQHGYFKTGYTVQGGLVNDLEGSSIEHCDVCGYLNTYSGSPEGRRIRTGYASPNIHPARIILVAEQLEPCLEADWDEAQQELVPVNQEGRLIIWLGSTKSAIKNFPESTILLEMAGCTILRAAETLPIFISDIIRPYEFKNRHCRPTQRRQIDLI